jgi:hypothetical protein
MVKVSPGMTLFCCSLATCGVVSDSGMASTGKGCPKILPDLVPAVETFRWLESRFLCRKGAGGVLTLFATVFAILPGDREVLESFG